MKQLFEIDLKDYKETEISLDATKAGRPLYKKCGFEDSGECMVLIRRE